MAYLFYAEKSAGTDLSTLQQSLACFRLVEFFPIEIRDEHTSLGICIPFKGTNEPQFAEEVVCVMRYLITEQRFGVIDLFSGKSVLEADILELPKLIAK